MLHCTDGQWESGAVNIPRSSGIPSDRPARPASLINNIQILRAVAAFMVVTIHAVNMTLEYGHPSEFFHRVKMWGWEGVDIFFVISGFVMVLTQDRKKRTPAAFMADRILRIVPPYWALTLALAVLVIAMPQMFRRLTLDASLLFHSLSFSTFTISADQPPLLHIGWTLEYEMVFYLIFAFCLFLPGWRLRIGLQAAALAVLTLTGVFSQLCLEFVLGELLALFYIAGGRIRGRLAVGLLLAIGVGGLLLPAVLGQSFDDFLLAHRVLVIGVPALCLVTAALYLPQSGNGLVLLLGDASYSIYLIQVFTLSIIEKLLQVATPWAPAALVVAACLIGTGVAGVIFHLLFERPVLKLGRRLLAKWNQPALAAA